MWYEEDDLAIFDIFGYLYYIPDDGEVNVFEGEKSDGALRTQRRLLKWLMV